MKVSGKTTSCAPAAAASAVSESSLSSVRSRSRMTGSAWTQATFTGASTVAILSGARQGHELVVDDDQPVARERLHRGAVELGQRARAGGDQAKRAGAPLAERSFERPLPALGLVSCGPARGTARERAPPQRGTRARHTVAPRSKSACAHSGPNSTPCARARGAMLTSTGSTAAEREVPDAAAVYGPTPGSSVRSSGQPCSATARAARCRFERAPVVPEPLPGADHVGGRARPRAPRPSATARATRCTAARRARPASAGASPRRRGSRTGRASAARAGRAVAREPVEQQLLHGREPSRSR